MKSLYVHILVYSICLLSYSCVTENIDREAFLEQEMEDRINRYKKDQLIDCKVEMLRDINMEVDSMMYFLVQKMKGNTDEMPQRPPRPGRLVDTIELEDIELPEDQ